MKLAVKFIEAAKEKEANPQFRQMVFDSVRKYKEKKKKKEEKEKEEKEKKEKRKKRRWW